MTLEILTGFVAILFVAIMYLHFKYLDSLKRLDSVSLINVLNMVNLSNIIRMLLDKKLIDQSDIDKLTDNIDIKK